LGAYGQNYANSIGQLNANNAANQTQSIYNRANANSNMVNSLAGTGGQLAGYYGNRPQTSYQVYQPAMQVNTGQPYAQPNFNLSTGVANVGAPNPYATGGGIG
jgi:hypothetical protein